MRDMRRMTVAAVVLAFACTTAGCASGSPSATPQASASVAPDGPSARELLDASIDFVLDATAVTMDVTMEDPKLGEVSTTIDAVAGEGAEMVVRTDDGAARVRAVDDRVYLNAQRRFLLAQGAPRAQANAAGGQWLIVDDTTFQTVSWAFSGEMRDIVDANFTFAGDPRIGGRGTVDGVDAIALIDDTGAALWVEAQAPHRPIRATLAVIKGSATFSNWDQPVDLTAPTDALDART